MEGSFSKRLLRYNRETGTETLLVDRSGDDTVESIDNLNLYNGKLYFLQEGAPRIDDAIYCLDPETGVCDCLYIEDHIDTVLVAYGKVFACCAGFPSLSDYTVVIDCDDPREISAIESFHIRCAMDGLLYGLCSGVAGSLGGNAIVTLDSYGNTVQIYDGAYTACRPRYVASDGRIVIFSNQVTQDFWDCSGYVWVIDVKTGEQTEFALPMPCNRALNVSGRHIYYQYFGEGDTAIYRVGFDGAGLERMSSWSFDFMCTLQGDEPLDAVVPCN